MTFIIIWIVCMVLGYMIGKPKGRSTAGIWLGLLLGPLGVIIALFLKSDAYAAQEYSLSEGGKKKCPQCAELIQHDAKLCRFCGHDFTRGEAMRPNTIAATPNDNTPIRAPENAEEEQIFRVYGRKTLAEYRRNKVSR